MVFFKGKHRLGIVDKHVRIKHIDFCHTIS
jgi:hypothetical protein